MGNFGLIVAQHYTGLYLRICSKGFFQTLQPDRVQKADKIHLSEISPKKLSWLNGQFWSDCVAQNYAMLNLRICFAG